MGGGEFDVSGVGIETLTATSFAGEGLHAFLVEAAHDQAFGVIPFAEELLDETAELAAVEFRSFATTALEDEILVTEPEEPNALLFLVEFLPRRFEHVIFGAIEELFASRGDATEELSGGAGPFGDAAEEDDCAVADGLGGIGDEQIGIEGVALADAITGGAHALRAIEAEELWGGRFEGVTATWAGVLRGDDDIGIGGTLVIEQSADDEGSFADAKGGFDSLSDALTPR